MTRPSRGAAVIFGLAVAFAGCGPGAAGDARSGPGGLSITIILPVNGTPVKGDVTIEGTASGPGGVALSVQLSIDGGPWYGADGGQSWSWLWSTYAFAEGPHNVSARVQGGADEALAFATYTVHNAPPTFSLRAPFPPGDRFQLRTGEAVDFNVTVETNYIGSVLVNWTVDGDTVKSGGESSYKLTALPGMLGNHTVEVRVLADGVARASHMWNLSVRLWAFPPVIAGFGPAAGNINVFRGRTVVFNVTATDPQARGLTYRWSVDSEPAPNVTVQSLALLFNSTGSHIVEVLVSNGETNRTLSWNVSVEEAPVLGPLDLLPCTLYIIIGLVLGIWHGRRNRAQGLRSRAQGAGRKA